MPRSDDYIINEAGSISDYDIVIDTLGFNFAGETPVQGKFGPGPTTAKDGPGETALIFSDLSNGMGMAYSGVPNTYAYTINGYARTPKKFMPGGKLTEISLDDFDVTVDELSYEIRAALEWNNDVYIGMGSYIIKLADGIGEPSIEYHTGDETQIHAGIVYNNIPLFSTCMLENEYQNLTGYKDGTGWVTAVGTGEALTSSAENPVEYANPVYLQYMKKTFQEVDGIGGWRLIGNDSLFTFVQIQSDDFDTIVGDSTAYSAPILVGDTSYAITGIIETNRIFFITKADGLYGVESSGIYCPNYIPDWKKEPSLLNGVSGEFFAGKVYVATHEGVEMVDVSNRERQDIPILISPSYYLSNETPIFGVPYAMTTDNGWLVVALYNGNDSHLCYIRPREHTNATVPNPVIWHGSECTIEGERITMLFKSSASGRPLMYIGTHNGTRMKLYTLSLPTEGDPYMDYLHGDGHEFAEECKLFLPFQDGDDPNAKKIIRRFEVQADGVTVPVIDDSDPDSDTYGTIIDTESKAELDFYANSDSGSRIFFETVEPNSALSEWEFQGTVSSSPKYTMIPSLNTISGSQIGICIVGRLLDQTPEEATPTYHPFAIRSIKVRMDIIVEQLEEKTYSILLGQLKATKTGRDHGDPQAKFAALVALQDADAVYMIDEWGERVLAKIEPGITYQVIQERKDQSNSIVANVKVTFLGRQFRYDIGHPFDGVYAWGA